MLNNINYEYDFYFNSKSDLKIESKQKNTYHSVTSFFIVKGSS